MAPVILPIVMMMQAAGPAYPCGIDKAGFTLVNARPSVPVEGLWYARSGTSEPWQQVEPETVIRREVRRAVCLNQQAIERGGCFYDIRVRFVGGQTETVARIDLCRNVTVTVG